MNKQVSGVEIKHRYKLRCLDIGDDSYFVNLYEDRGQGHFVFGDLIHFTKGHMQALFDANDENAAVVRVDQMGPPQQKEFVHSQMFWLAVGDHVFVLQSRSLDSSDLESYLSWLSIAQTAVLPMGTPIALAFAFDSQVVGEDLSNIRKITVGGAVHKLPPAVVHVPASSSQTTQQSASSSDTETEADGQVSKGELRKVLEALFSDDAVKVDALLNRLPDEADLRVNVSIGFETNKRNLNREMLRDITVGLRNLPDADIQVETTNTKVSRDGTIRLMNKCQIKMIKKSLNGIEQVGSLLDPSDVLTQMMKTFQDFLASGKIRR